MDSAVHTHTQPIPFVEAERDLGVIVGYDGSDQGTLALLYAARAAQRRSVPLTVVNAFTVPAVVLTGMPEADPDALGRRGAEAVLDGARDYLKDYPGEVSYRVEQGDAAGVMVRLSKKAQMAVVGGRGRGGFLGRVLGSVASALPAHALCPTVVVPRSYESTAGSPGAERFAPSKDSSPVVVGADGSSHGRVAALQAAQSATDRGTALRIVLALPPLDGSLIWYPELADQDSGLIRQRRAELEEKVTAEARWVSTHYPDLTVEGAVESGTPDEVLIRESGTAQLTVVGTRGRGGIASTLLGSVSRGLLLGAEGPVMVVPKLDDTRLENQPHFAV